MPRNTTPLNQINEVICGDAIAGLENLPPASIDLVLFSPPYDGIRTYDGIPNLTLSSICFQIERVLVEGGVAIMVIQDQTKNFRKSLTTFRTIIDWEDAGLSLWECLIYQRPGKPGAWWSTRFRVDHEYIPIFFKGDRPQYFNKDHMKIPSKHAGKKYHGTQRLTNGTLIPIEQKTVAALKCPGTVLPYASSNSEGNKRKMKHPATFPDKLAADLIQTFTLPGYIVCDPMCGSGTTLVQAQKLNRQFIGFDINKEYCELSRERLDHELK